MGTRIQIINLFISLQITERISILEELILLASGDELAYISTHEDSNFIPLIEKLSTASNIQMEEVQCIESKVEAEAIVVPPQCPECHGNNVIKWGKYKNVSRFYCRDCKHTSTPLSGNAFHHARKPETFKMFGQKMFDGQYSSLSFLSKELNISPKTAFEWRHKYLSALSSSGEKERFVGFTEIDDVWFLLNEKGRKDKNEKRKRGGTVKQGDNNMQVKVLFTSDRQGDANISVVRAGRLKNEDVKRAVGGCFEKDAQIVCDKHPSILSFAKKADIQFDSFKSKEHVKDELIHVQTVNNMARRFGDIINRKMNGVATKYLQNYANWFKMQDRFKQTKGKVIDHLETFVENNLAWKYYINIEKIYQRFIEKYSQLHYEHPVKKEWKSMTWTFEQVESVLL